MEITDKFLKNIQKIMKVRGFIISTKGDPSVGINPASWKIEEDFYFDDQEELEEFRGELIVLFGNYCGELAFVETYEEYQKQIDAEDIEYFREFPVRYLIVSKFNHIYDKGYGSSSFKQADFCASYSSDIGTAIHRELPKWMHEDGDSNTVVIKSTEPRYREILLEEAERLEHQIGNEEYRLNIAKKNLRIIEKELNIGLKAK